MCNTKQPTNTPPKNNSNNQQLLFYRLDQLEENQRKDTETIITTLKVIQEGINESNKTLILHTEQITQLQKTTNEKVDKDKYQSDMESLTHRLDIYQKILLGVGVAVVGAIIIELIKIL